MVRSGGCIPAEELFMETKLFWEGDPGRRVCAYHGRRWRKGTCGLCLFPRTGLHVPVLWEKGSEGHRDVPVKVCQKSGNERVCTALGRRFVFDDF